MSQKTKKSQPADGTLVFGQIDLVAAISDWIDRQAKLRGYKQFWARTDQYNAIVKAADIVVDAFRQPTRVAGKGAGVDAWLASHDTGLSSLAMCQRLFGRGDASQDSDFHPLDPDDFGRCYRLLRAVPEAKSRLNEVADISPVWSRLVGAWDELESLYEEELPSGSAPKLYARMKELIGGNDK